jgi:hypothetical protein
VTYQNNGRIQSASLSTYLGMTITAGETYFYDTSGKIQRLDETVMGTPAGSASYRYTASGNLASIVQPAGSSADNEFYTYDAGGNMATHIYVDSTGATTDAMTFTCTGGLISRIDEAQSGVPSSYRLIIRDASGFITREDLYAPGGVTPVGSINYVRDDASKTITVQMLLGGQLGCDELFSYDTSGFIQSTAVNFYVMGSLFYYVTISNTLQTGPFDAAGMDGYYYTDKDLFGVLWIKTSASGGFSN